MVRQWVHSRWQRHCSTAFLLLAVAMPLASAQPGNNAHDQFGNRQSGHWGDPGRGYFGNPAVGDFDKSQIRPPPPGAKPLGKVYSGKGPELSPYITLPTPADAATEILPPAAVRPAATPTKKPTRKRSGKKTG